MDISDSTNLQTLFSRTSSLISLFDLISPSILQSCIAHLHGSCNGTYGCNVHLVEIKSSSPDFVLYC
ncbi:hypothetical protein CGMCC3_g6550 [Colletotrichum fructicola]|nr:uncharacterized protein CGMCC3_g6550 [Colletotrichum fructicola]KAE9577550.1 hypothetical protein CGMCC3_g6550 [Colletotrichum fructicola]